MNLLDIRKQQWDETLLQLCGDETLQHKLGQPVPSDTEIGVVSRYLCDRYGFRADCKVFAFTGDNPSSLAAIPFSSKDLVLSLGTSDTLFFSVENPKPGLVGHVLCHPIKKESFMGMLVFKNGGLPVHFHSALLLI
jgi:xylulokinase